MSRRNERVSVAIISEGDTEAWYFNQLSRAERVYISTFPKEGRKLTSMLKKAEDLICDNSYDFIFCMIDMDTITSSPKRTKLNKLIN
ncbi:MAG: RloB domain-containing protein, partial [Candidatus Cloacimonetes bacterium]|nr:RloB domain-containing protein [Candidatus Cloacimonadota bacterium]